MPSYEIETKGRFRRSVRNLTKAQQLEVVRALDSLPAVFGQPHRHTGLGIRRLRRNFFECRAGLAVRLIFEVQPLTLLFHDAGSHDDVQRFLRNL